MSAAVKRLSQDMSGADVTPRRPVRSARDPADTARSVSARTLFVDDADQTPRKGLGLPTPPNSETTGSGTGSVGRAAGRNQSQQLDESESALTPHGSLSRTAGQSVSRRVAANTADRSSVESRYSTLGRRRGAEALTSSSSSPEMRSDHVASTSMQRNGSTTTIRNEAAPGSAPRSIGRAKAERQRTSARHEQEVTDLRASSRAGRRPEEEEYLGDNNGTLRSTGTLSSPRRRERNQTITPTSTGDSTATDTSGTEGAGSVPRRRKKKSSNSLGKGSNPPNASRRGSRSSPGHDWDTSSRTDNDEDYRRRTSTSSRASTSDRSTKAFPSDRRPSPHRRPTLPPDFRQFEGVSRYRSDSIGAGHDHEYDDDSTLDAEITLEGDRRWVLPQPRRRYASDASTNDIPRFEYEGRGGTHESRLSVDSGAVARHLQSRPSVSDQQNAWDPYASPSEEARARKASLASRSSGGASDRMSSRSRASGRASRGDVFDDNPVTSHDLPSPALPSHRSDNIRVLEERMAALEAPIRPSDSISARGAGSAASSVVSRTQLPRTVQTQRTVDLVGEGHYSARPSTEPRPQRSERSTTIGRSGLPASHTVPNRIDGGASELRSSLRNFSERAPVTPDLYTSSRAASRLTQSSALPDAARFPSSDHSSHVSGGSGSGGDALPHIQVLLNSLSMFERYFGGSSGSQPSTPSSGQGVAGGAESLELVGNLQQVSHSARFINEGLRKLQHSVIQARVDEQLSNDANGSGRLADQLHRIDSELTAILRQSDSGIRALTNGLIGFARVEKERDRMRRVTSDSGSVGRPASRLQSLHYSPQREQPRRAATQAYEDEVSRRSSEYRSLARRQESAADGHAASTGRAASDHSGNSGPTNGRPSLDVSDAPPLPRSPFSPVTQRNGEVDPRLSPTLATNQTLPGRLRSPYGHHTRSASEAITLRRGKASNTSDTTARPPDRHKMPTLSPRRTEAAKVTPAVIYATHDQDDHELGAAQAAMDRLSIEDPNAQHLPGSHDMPPINASLKRSRAFVSEPQEFDRSQSVTSRRNTVGSSDGYPTTGEAPARPPRRDLASLGRRSFAGTRDTISVDEPQSRQMRSSTSSATPALTKRDSTGIFSRIRSLGPSAGKRTSQVFSGDEAVTSGSAASRRSSRDFGA